MIVVLIKTTNSSLSIVRNTHQELALEILTIKTEKVNLLVRP